MTNLKYSKQRESIKEFLSDTTDHPTADTVYLHVRKEFPRISLGTVYRNLNLLADIGEAVKIATPDGGDRFDGTTHPHYHLLCTECGKVMDLDMDIQSSLNSLAEKSFDGVVHSHTALFYGSCHECSGRKSKKY